MFIINRLVATAIAVPVYMAAGGAWRWWLIPAGFVAGSAYALVDPFKRRAA
jgi:hypothetical protein